MNEQNHVLPCPAADELANGPEEQQRRPGGTLREGMTNVVLPAVEVLLDMLAWWPEAALAGQACLAALQVRQGSERE